MNVLEARRVPTRVILWALLAAVLVLYGFPFLYLVLTSLKTPTETIAIPPQIWPETWSIANYTSALSRNGVGPAIINSVVVAVLSTVLSLILGVPAAYAITRFRTVSGRVFVLTTLIIRMVPPIAIGAPLVETMRLLGISDTVLALAIAHTTFSLPLSIWLMASYFEAVPDELEEAARVDGATRLGALWRVVIPVVAGGLAVTAMFAFLASWNEFLFALLLTSVRSQTMPIVIANFQTQYGLDWAAMTAIATVYSIPVILLTFVLQRQLVAGLTFGAVKG